MTTPVQSVNEAFLRLLFRADWHRVSVCSVFDLEDKAWPARGARDAFPLDIKANNYFCVSLMKDPSTRKKEEFEALAVLVLDDVGPKGDPVKIRAALGEPAYRLRTSPLNEQWGYRLDPLVHDRTRAERLLKRVVDHLYGGKDPGMMGVTRIMRLPVGTNTKKHLGKDGFETRLWSAIDSPTRTITADTVEAAFPLADDKISYGSTSSPAIASAPANTGPVPAGQGTVDPVVLALRRLEYVLGGRRKSAGGEGWDIICPWQNEHSPTGAVNTGTFYFRGGGIKCWHGHCDNRRPEDVRKRVDELLKIDSGGLVGLDDLDPAQFDAVDPAQVPASPVAHTSVPDAVRRFQDEIVYLKNEDKWLDLRDNGILIDKALDVVWGRRLDGLTPLNGKGNPIRPSVWARTAFMHRVIDARVWWPGKPLVFAETIDGTNLGLANLWRDPPRPLRNADWAWLDGHVRASPWWELMDALIGTATSEQQDNGRRLRFYMAMIVGGLDVKPGHNPLLMGPQGAGKEHIWAPILDWLGPGRSRQLMQIEIGGPFTDWYRNRLVMMPELRRTTRGMVTDHDQYQDLKVVLDPGKRFLSLNEKYHAPVQVLNCAVMVFTTNEDRPLSLAPDDRRFWVIRVQDTAAAGWTPTRHQQLANWRAMDNGHGGTNNEAIVEWLIRMWDPDLMLGEVQGHAPVTRDKRDLIHRAGGAMLEWLEDRLDSKPPSPLALRDLITAHELVDLAEAAIRSGDQGLPRRTSIPSAEAMGKLMAQAGCRKLNRGTPVLVASGDRRRIWAHRDADPRYDALNTGDLALEWNQSRHRRPPGP